MFPIDAAVLNNVAQTFGLMDTVKRVLDNRRKQVEQGEGQYLYTLAGMWTDLFPRHVLISSAFWRVDVSLRYSNSPGMSVAGDMNQLCFFYIIDKVVFANFGLCTFSTVVINCDWGDGWPSW